MSTTRKTPKLRFPEFTGDWEQRKLSDISERVTRKNKNLEYSLPQITFTWSKVHSYIYLPFRSYWYTILCLFLVFGVFINLSTFSKEI